MKIMEPSKGKDWEDPLENNYKGGTLEVHYGLKGLMTDMLEALATLQVEFYQILEQQWMIET